MQMTGIDRLKNVMDYDHWIKSGFNILATKGKRKNAAINDYREE